MTDQAVLFGDGDALVGVVTDPDKPVKGLPGVIMINAGVVHRVGPHRLHVKLARRLAEAGFVSARFDLSGVGDSAVRTDNLPSEKSIVVETRQMMDHLQRSRGVDRFVLAGICSGAVASFKTACADDRVVGVGLINIQGIDQSEAWNKYVLQRGWVRHYLTSSLLRPASWIKAVTGRIQYRRLVTVLAMAAKNRVTRSSEVVSVVNRLGADWQCLVDRGVKVLVVGSQSDVGVDPSIDYVDAIIRDQPEAVRQSIQIKTITGSDHTFTYLRAQDRLMQVIDEWLGVLPGVDSARAAGSRQ